MSSIVAAICYAWMQSSKGDGHAAAVPVVNMRRSRMTGGRQAAWLLYHVGVDASALLFADEVGHALQPWCLIVLRWPAWDSSPTDNCLGPVPELLGVYNLGRGDKDDEAIQQFIAVVCPAMWVFLIPIGTMWPPFHSSEWR